MSSNKIIAHLGAKAASHLAEGIESPRDLEKIWDEFLASGKISHVDESCRAILAAARSRSLVEIGNLGDSYLDLGLAHDMGYGLVNDILNEHSLGELMPSEQATLHIFYDSLGTHYCVGSSRLAHNIRWAHQPVPHALSGILIADLVLAHEYLSHIVPRNSHLDQTVREAWLVAALREAFLKRPDVEDWKKTLWTEHRSAVLRHVASIGAAFPSMAGIVGFEGLQGLDEQAIRLYAKSESVFWAFTREILEHQDSRGIAEDLTFLLHEFVKRNNDGLKAMLSVKAMKINVLLQLFQ